MMRELDCLQCGARYMGTDRSRFCPACRKERQRKWAKEHDICHGGARARWRKHDIQESTEPVREV